MRKKGEIAFGITNMKDKVYIQNDEGNYSTMCLRNSNSSISKIFSIQKVPFAYSVANRAWQLFNKRNRAGTQALGKFLYFSICSLKSVYLNICFIKRDCGAIHNSNKELQKAVFHLFFLLVFHIPIQNFTATDAYLSAYRWLSLCLPMNNGNVMLRGSIVESRPMISECF